MQHTDLRDAAQKQLIVVQGYLSGAEGIWIGEEDWREQATYERDTNAWVNDPYDRVSASEIAADATALQSSAKALATITPHVLPTITDADDRLELTEAATGTLKSAAVIIENGGNPRDPDGYVISTQDLAEAMHDLWLRMETAWAIVLGAGR